MGESMQGQLAVLPRTVVVTTKDDFQHFGRGLASAVGAITLGSMDFGTDRGIAALNTNERSIHMPDIRGHADLVVVAKAIIATGCTAITLTKAAMNKYKTKDLIVVSAFHSREGIRELVDEFPHATIVVDQALVGYLTRDELQALLDAPDLSTVPGIRDRAMLHLAFAAGMRVSELVGLRLDQIDRSLSTVHIMGKGRRERVLPLWKETATAVKAWLKVRPASGSPELFLNARAQAMTRSGFEYILAKHVATAARGAPSIAGKSVSPHVLRHTCAMHTLQATRDVRKVSLWLGHSSLQSTEAYLRADPTEKLEALAAMTPPMLKPGRFRAPDKLLAMLSMAGRKPKYAE
jgi:site-specific recombinase XerD